MKLLSAVVRNYRLHRETSVDFDDARTLIGGLNESGKSTLIEAIHRGLFLKATVTGEARARMESTLYPGHPEVEIRFEAHGAEYRLLKRFSGQSGTTRLVQAGGQTWQGEEAQSHLADLLGVSQPGGGRGILDRVSEQWAHLWVWQGEGGKDPAECLVPQKAELLEQLQKVGGAVAMQSGLDGQVASWFSQARNEIFTLAGAPKRGSELEKALGDLNRANEAWTMANERLEALRRAADDYEEASAVIKRTASDREELERQRQEVNEKLFQVEQLRRAEEAQSSAVSGVEEKLASLEGTEKSIAELRGSIEDLQKSLEPLEERRERLGSKLADIRRRKGEAEQAYDQVLETTRDARLKAELAGAYASRFQREARCLELSARQKRVRDLQEELDQIRGQIAQLVPIDQAGLEELQDLENKRARSSAVLNATAAEVEVVVSDRPVRVGKVQVSAGESHTIAEPTEVTVGDQVRLRIHPGGGDTLAQARDEVRSLREELQRLLDAYGLESIKQATEMVVRRVDLQSRQGAKENKLGEWDPEKLAMLLKQAQDELAAAQADVQRRLGQVAGAEAPPILVEAEALLAREKDALQIIESGETTARTTLEALRRQLGECEAEFSVHRDKIEGERQKLTGLSAQLELLVRNHGVDDARSRLLSDTRTAKANLETELSGIRHQLDALQPDLLEADRDRLRRAWEETDRQNREADNRRAVSQAALLSDGIDDPNTALAQAAARLEAATEHHRAVSCKSSAIALVDDLFRQEQRALADQFSRPVAEKISAYLRCLFGPEAEAVVTFEDNAFKGIRLARRGEAGATSFETLSEGAREQVAAAVRLAIAELLAADHDGSLPVVFDDAFAYSDPERVSALQRMLDLAASHGLQIIVLTCNPSDYAALGARQIVLKQPVAP